MRDPTASPEPEEVKSTRVRKTLSYSFLKHCPSHCCPWVPSGVTLPLRLKSVRFLSGACWEVFGALKRRGRSPALLVRKSQHAHQCSQSHLGTRIAQKESPSALQLTRRQGPTLAPMNPHTTSQGGTQTQTQVLSVAWETWEAPPSLVGGGGALSLSVHAHHPTCISMAFSGEGSPRGLSPRCRGVGVGFGHRPDERGRVEGASEFWSP